MTHKGAVFGLSDSRAGGKKQKNNEMTEDELKLAEDQIQKLTDKKVAEIDKMIEVKEKEIMSV